MYPILPVSLDCPFWLPIRHSLTLFNVQGKLIRIILLLGYRRRRCLTHCNLNSVKFIVGICNLSYRTALFMIVAEAPFAQRCPMLITKQDNVFIGVNLTLFRLQ
jgi:hypothetical protein